MDDLLHSMASVWQHIDKPILVSDSRSLTFESFALEVSNCVKILKDADVRSVALIADNSIEWIIVDFACQILDVSLLPLPSYFSSQQAHYSINDAGCDVLFCDGVIEGYFNNNSQSEENKSPYDFVHIENYRQLKLYKIKGVADSQLPIGTSKITYTSGSTGQPKGVCLSRSQQWQVAASIKQRVATDIDKHLCILPLAVLLENVAGVYSALLNGSTVVVKSLSTLGFTGSSSLDFNVLLTNISQVKPSSLITTPEILKGLVIAAEQGWQVPSSFKFIAVGGARVADKLLQRAISVKLPVYQGYGLSECSSVVSLNAPDQNQLGSTGKMLPHVNVSLDNGEIVIEDNLFLGYAGSPDSWYPKSFKTGDLGYVDDSGFLHVNGRKKNLLISSYGRNINPEWIESELLSSSLLKQAYVFGDGRPYCIAALCPMDQKVDDAQITHWLTLVNTHLPDYAQVKAWFIYRDALTPASGMITDNGRPKRVELTQHFNTEITRTFQQSSIESAELELLS